MAQPKIHPSALETGAGANKVVVSNGSGTVVLPGPLSLPATQRRIPLQFTIRSGTVTQSTTAVVEHLMPPNATSSLATTFILPQVSNDFLSQDIQLHMFNSAASAGGTVQLRAEIYHCLEGNVLSAVASTDFSYAASSTQNMYQAIPIAVAAFGGGLIIPNGSLVHLVITRLGTLGSDTCESPVGIVAAEFQYQYTQL